MMHRGSCLTEMSAKAKAAQWEPSKDLKVRFSRVAGSWAVCLGISVSCALGLHRAPGTPCFTSGMEKLRAGSILVRGGGLMVGAQLKQSLVTTVASFSSICLCRVCPAMGHKCIRIEVGLTDCQPDHPVTVPLLNISCVSKGHTVLDMSHYSSLSLDSCSVLSLCSAMPTPGREDTCLFRLSSSPCCTLAFFWLSSGFPLSLSQQATDR